MAHTFDPANNGGNITLSNGNLTATSGSGVTWTSILTTPWLGSLDWYAEIAIGSVTGHGMMVGTGDTSATLSGYLGSDNHGIGLQDIGQIYANGAGGTPGFPTFASGDVVQIACKNSTSHWWARVNSGLWNNDFFGVGADPAADSGGLNAYAASGLILSVVGTGNAATLNFGATPFGFSVPSGFVGPDGSGGGGGGSTMRAYIFAIAGQ